MIIEAYYGLADHIYQIEAGLLLFSMPQTAEEYSNKLQILPVTKQLQLLVSASSLSLPRTPSLTLRGFFNPCVNVRSKCLLYLRYKYREMEKVVVYDFNREELVVPRDV